MFRLLLGSNGGMLKSIVTKWTVKMLRKYGLTADIKCEDFVVYRDGDDLLIHVCGDVKVSEKELLKFVNDRFDA